MLYSFVLVCVFARIMLGLIPSHTPPKEWSGKLCLRMREISVQIPRIGI